MATVNGSTSPKRTFPHVVTQEDLGTQDRDRMYSIICEHFDNVDREVFDHDLAEKDWIIRVDDEQGTIQGFSTLRHMVGHLDGERVHAFFSGDTVLSRQYLSESSWMGVWIDLALEQAARFAPEKSYWLLMTATHRTYRILPSCFNQYIPHMEVPPDPKMRELLEIFAVQKFPGEFVPEAGVVVLANPIPYRNAEEVEASAGEHHAANRFFRQRNPGYLRGDFLCCLAEISFENLNRLGRRFVSENFKARAEA